MGISLGKKVNVYFTAEEVEMLESIVKEFPDRSQSKAVKRAIRECALNLAKTKGAVGKARQIIIAKEPKREDEKRFTFDRLSDKERRELEDLGVL